MLNNALKECEDMGDWTDTQSIIVMANVDTENIVRTVIENMDLNVRSPMMADTISQSVTVTAENWRKLNYGRLEALK